MATTQQPTTDDAPTLPSSTYQWPRFDRDHDPEPLTTNDPTPTERTTLADFGGIDPTDPDRPQLPMDTRDRTEQTSVFAYPRPWWDDADRLEWLYHDRDLAIGEIAALFGDDIGYEVVRSNLITHEVRDPATDGSLADKLAAMNPEDVGDPLPDAFTDDGGASA